jgi:hypothetical protein
VPLDQVARVTLLQHLADAAVHHEVRVATDRRSEVCVVLEREAEVADVAGLVDRLRHRADDGRGYQAGIGSVTDLLQQVAQVRRA